MRISSPIFLRLGFVWLFVCFFLSCGNSYAQGNRTIDSLIRELPNMKPDTHKVKVLLRITSSFIEQDVPKTIEYSKRATALADSLDYGFGKAKAGYFRGVTYTSLGSYDKAIEAFLSSLEVYKRLDDLPNMAQTYNIMGNMYNHMKAQDEARKYYALSHDLYSKIGQKHEILVTRNNRATTFMDELKYEEAMPILRQNLLEAAELNYDDLVMLSCNNIGYICQEWGFLDSTVYYYQEGLKHKEGAQMKLAEAFINSNLIEVYTLQKDYEAAEKHLKIGLALSDEVGDLQGLMRVRELQFKLYAATKRYPEALAVNDIYMELRDSLYNEEKRDKVKNMEVAWEAEQKDQEIALLKREQIARDENYRLQTWLLVIASLGIGLLAIMLFLLAKGNRKTRKVNEALTTKQLELEKSQQLLLERNKDLEIANHEKDSLIGIVAHDIRSPLTNTEGLLNMIVEEDNLSKSQQKAVSMIHRSLDKGKSLIKDLLDLYSSENSVLQDEFELFDVEVCIREIANEKANIAAKKSIELEVSVHLQGLQLRSHLNSLQRVLDNLLSNAIKFSNASTSVQLRAEKRGNALQIEIEDQGPGISEEDQKKMFGKFQRLTARPTAGESSTGLGLSIVHNLCEKLSIAIDVDSEVGRGTIFRLLLPVGE